MRLTVILLITKKTRKWLEQTLSGTAEVGLARISHRVSRNSDYGRSVGHECDRGLRSGCVWVETNILSPIGSVERVISDDFLRVGQSDSCAWPTSAITGTGCACKLAAQRYLLQPLHDLPEQLGIRITFGKGDPDPADTDPDLCTNLEQLQANGVALSLGHGRIL